MDYKRARALLFVNRYYKEIILNKLNAKRNYCRTASIERKGLSMVNNKTVNNTCFCHTVVERFTVEHTHKWKTLKLD